MSCLVPIPPNPPAAPMHLFSSPFPLKFLLCTLTLPFFPFVFRLCRHKFWVSRGPQALSKVQHVPQLPLYPPESLLLPNLFYFFIASQPPALHIFLPFFGSFLPRTQKGAFTPSLSFSSCVLSAQGPHQPAYTTNFPPSLPTSAEMPPLHLNLLFFYVCFRLH